MKTQRTCAYCGDGSNLTNEHVFPKCFRKNLKAITTAKTPTGEKAILADLEIHDVCSGCNHGPLSRLDTYLCALNDKYFLGIVRSGDQVRFEFDFDQLLRVLLKIGYNVARARKWPLGNWQEVLLYVLGTSLCPSGFRVFLQLMIPTPVQKTNLPVSPGTTEVPPLPLRVYSVDVGRYPGVLSAYWLSFWSYRFFVLQEDARVPRSKRKQAIEKWLRKTKGAKELNRRGVATMHASSVMVLDDTNESPIFHEQLSKARKLKAAMELKKASSSGR